MQLLFTLPLKAAVHACELNVDGEYLLVSGPDREILLFNAESGKFVKKYAGAHGYGILDLAIASDNSGFASVGGDKTAFVWDVATSNVVRRLAGHSSRINTVTYNSTLSTVLITGSADRSVRCWDLRGRNPNALQCMSDARDAVTSISCQGNAIAIASVDGYLRTYDIRMGSLVSDCMGYALTSAQQNRDSSCTLLSLLDSSVKLLDNSDGSILQTFSGHKHTEYRLNSTFDYDEARVISGSEDGKIFVWNVEDAKLLGNAKAHSQVVTKVVAHPSKFRIVTASVDGNVKVWEG